MEITTRNANTMFQDMFWRLKTSGIPVETRNGPALRIPEPVMTTVKYPQERILFHHGRDANPIFHMLEPIWMLAGRRDVAFLKRFNSKIGAYSDNGKIFNAAYGYRWRHHFGNDQLIEVIQQLRKNHDTRQAVVQMWAPEDLTKNTKDKACNMQLIFEIQNEKLNMTVINRSNDAWWGYAGANIVHFSVVQEFVASAVCVNLGVYRTFSTNLHLYTELYSATKYIENPPVAEDYDLYSACLVRPAPILGAGSYRTFLEECELFCDDPIKIRRYSHPFFTNVAYPLAMISHTRKTKAGDGSAWAAKITHEDIRRAANDWIHRRELALAEK